MDEKKKRTLLIIGIVIVVLMIITAVLLLIRNSRKTDTDSSDEQSVIAPGTNVELAYWGLWEPDSVMQPIIDEFEAMYPNINILYSQQTFTNYESRLFTRLQQATSDNEPAPDIFRIHNTWVPKYYSYLSPLPSTVMSAQEYSELFYPTAVEDFTSKDGNIYAIPWEIDGLMVYYNKQLLSEAGVQRPPEDWDSFFELAQKLTTKDSSGRITQSGLAIGTSRNIRHSAEILSFFLIQEGVDVIDQTRTKVSLNTPKAQSVFETYTNFARGDTAVWSPNLRTDLEMFFAGELAMMIGPSWRAFDIIEAAPTIEFDTAPLPQLKANEEKIYFSTYWGDAVSKTAKNTDAAWAFIKFLSEKEQQMNLYSRASQIRAFGEPYSLVELNSEMLERPYVSAIAEMAPYMKSWQKGDEMSVNSALDEAITDIIENGTDADIALKKAEEAINAKIEITNK
jgi:ABC-type glycerol-3-phosphate transport system substrate-binding protein